MLHFDGQGILLDIEGTTSSIGFVYDQMFPYVRRELNAFLATNWRRQAVVDAVARIVRDAGHASLPSWCPDDAASQQRIVAAEVIRLMDGDVKATGLKQLQGLIWESGFNSGELVAHVYDDVLPALSMMAAAGRSLRIYSSGSVKAQQLFFAHTEHGDLTPLFDGFYDTTTGAKQEIDSYCIIARDFGETAADLLFISDVPAELDAARAAGWQTSLCIRPGNKPVGNDHGHPVIHSFAEIDVAP